MLEKTKEEAEQLVKQKEEQIRNEREKAEKLIIQKVKEERVMQEKIKAQKKKAEQKLLKAFSLTKVEFKTSSMQLTSKSKELLNTTAKVMKEYPQYNYKIKGYTDNRGSEAKNISLSKKRADVVKDYLVSQGVDASLLWTEGYGEAHPIADNATEAGRVKNRRVVFEIIR